MTEDKKWLERRLQTGLMSFYWSTMVNWYSQAIEPLQADQPPLSALRIVILSCNLASLPIILRMVIGNKH